MRTVADAFEEFRKRLELSVSERNDASRRQQEVRKCIRSSFDIARDFLTGSYARDTKTKPLKDVDVFFVLGPKNQHWRQKAPILVLQAFEGCLTKEYGEESVDPGRRCVTVEFDKKNPTVDKEGKVLSIDAIPAIELSDCYEIPDRTLGKWIKSDPDIHASEATAKNQELNGKWVPLVKMLKRWNRSAGKPIEPSFLVEVMAQDLVDGPFSTYESEVRRFFGAALEGVHRDWPDPAGYGPPVSDEMTQAKRRAAADAVRQAETSAALAVRHEKDGRQGEALRLWGQILGKYFPTS